MKLPRLPGDDACPPPTGAATSGGPRTAGPAVAAADRIWPPSAAMSGAGLRGGQCEGSQHRAWQGPGTQFIKIVLPFPMTVYNNCVNHVKRGCLPSEMSISKHNIKMPKREQIPIVIQANFHQKISPTSVQSAWRSFSYALRESGPVAVCRGNRGSNPGPVASQSRPPPHLCCDPPRM